MPARLHDIKILPDQFAVALDMLDHVEADDGVDRFFPYRVIHRVVGQIHVKDARVFEMTETAEDHLDIERIVIDTDQPLAIDEKLGEVADAASGFQHALADELIETGEQPLIESVGLLERAQDVE